METDDYDSTNFMEARVVEVMHKANNFSSSKYQDIIQAVPDHSAHTHACHSKCYKSFTGLSLKNISFDYKPCITEGHNERT